MTACMTACATECSNPLHCYLADIPQCVIPGKRFATTNDLAYLRTLLQQNYTDEATMLCRELVFVKFIPESHTTTNMISYNDMRKMFANDIHEEYVWREFDNEFTYYLGLNELDMEFNSNVNEPFGQGGLYFTTIDNVRKFAHNGNCLTYITIDPSDPNFKVVISNTTARTNMLYVERFELIHSK